MVLLSNVRFFSILLFIGVGMIVGVLMVTYKAKKAVKTSAFWAHHAESIISETHRALSLAKDLQVGGRGYIITGDSTFLEPIDRARTEVPRVMSNMKTLTLDNPIQGKRIDSAAVITQSLISHVDEYIKTNRKNSSMSPSGIKGYGKTDQYVKALQKLLERIQRAEFRLLELRKEASGKNIVFLDGLLTSLFAGQAVFMLFLFFMIWSNFLPKSRIEQEQVNSEIRFRGKFDKMLEGVEIIGFDWRYLYVNEAYEKQVRCPKESLLGFTIMEKFPGIEQTEIYKSVQRCFDQRKLIHLTDSFTFPDGNTQWFEISFQPVPEGVFIMSVDITERVINEQALKKSLKDISDYKYALDEAAIVAITDQDGRIKHVNENFCKISEYTFEELIGQNHRTIVNSDYNAKPAIHDLWATMEKREIWKGELENKSKNGRRYWLDTTIVPFLDELGKPYQYLAIQFDVTATRKAEEKIRQSENIYRTIASSIPGSVICLLDHDFRCMLIEGEMSEKMGYPKDALLGNVLKDIVSTERYNEIYPHFERVFGGETFTIEGSAGGFDVLSKYVPLRNEHNMVFAAMVVIFDVSELKSTQRALASLNHNLEDKIRERTAELEVVNKALESFSYSVAHDLRTPLRAIYGYSIILEEDYSPTLDNEGKRLVTRVIHNAKRMGTLIDDLLTFSRLGRKEIQHSNIDMNHVVESCINDLNLKEGFHGAIKVKELDPIIGDSSLIKYAMINLLSNAVKYSSKKEKPVIEISSERKGQNVIYSIKDNGIGFDMEYADKLFGVFQRLHSHEEFDGTGVGLAIVQRIIHRHQGSIWGEGRVNNGATFYISLPDKQTI